MMGTDVSYPLPGVTWKKVQSCPVGRPCRWANKVTVTEQHPYLSIKSLNYDPKHRFAIVTMMNPVPFDGNTGPLCLPEVPSRDSYREQGTVLGFGYTKAFFDTVAETDVHKQKQRTIVSQTFDNIKVTKSCRETFLSFAHESRFKREGWAGWMEM